MTDAELSRRGRRARRSGHEAERRVAGFLREAGFPDAKTTRQALGHDGTKQPGDVVGLDGWLVSVKNRVGSAWPSWCAEAAEEARGGRWVVVRRLPGTTDVSRWPARWSLGGEDDGVYPATVGEFLSIVVPFYASAHDESCDLDGDCSCAG